MDWAIIIDMIIQMISECMENRSRKKVRKRLRRPRGRETWAFRCLLSGEFGLTGRELTRRVREGMDELKALTDRELDAVLDAAEAA